MNLAGGVLLVPVLFEEAGAIRLAGLRGGGGDQGDLGIKAPVWRPCSTLPCTWLVRCRSHPCCLRHEQRDWHACEGLKGTWHQLPGGHARPHRAHGWWGSLLKGCCVLFGGLDCSVMPAWDLAIGAHGIMGCHSL